MISLKTESDVLAEARRQIREVRQSLGWRQADLAQRSGVPLPTLRRFEQTGSIGFPAFLKLIVSLGLADRFLDGLRPALKSAPIDLRQFLAPAERRQRIRRKTTN